MSNSIRYAQASAFHEAGLRKVQETPAPERQKFAIGSRVHIQDDLTEDCMEHFKSGCDATVKYTYAHAYGGANNKSYCLEVDDYGSNSWYHEHQLTQIEGVSNE